jgi:hypothetical protein
MKKLEASWSMATAMRAVFMSAKMDVCTDDTQLMKDIQSSWGAEPICTSVVIVFWQRYLTKLAQSTSVVDGQCATAQADSKAVELIRQVMPVKSDRGLPGDLQSAMTSCGWSQLENVLRWQVSL